MTMLDPLSAYFTGRISPYVALARLALSGCRAAEIESMLRPHYGPLASNISKILLQKWVFIDDLARSLTNEPYSEHQAVEDGSVVSSISAYFDRSARRNAEASVAAYSLGDPAILAAATSEILSWLHSSGLLHKGSVVLDLGCGFGRVAAALSLEGHTVLGLDASPQMICEARSRYGNLQGLRFQLTTGLDLPSLPDAKFNLVLAVDSFPYVMFAGPDVVVRHFTKIRRCLRSGGTFVILNFSYRDDPAADSADAARLAKANGFRLLDCGSTPFALWDAAAFIFRT